MMSFSVFILYLYIFYLRLGVSKVIAPSVYGGYGSPALGESFEFLFFD